jgi:predicted methyltransferase
MKHAVFAPLSLVLVVACSGSTPPPPAPPPAEPIASPAPPPPEPAKPAPAPEPTEAEKKAAEQLKTLQADRAKARATFEAEKARLTPEIVAAAKAIADKAYPTGAAALKAALTSPARKPGDPERDARRHAVETLTLCGFSPKWTVLEYGPGEGWYTELLAPALYKQGKLLVTSPDPAGPQNERPSHYGQITKWFIEKAPELYGKIETVLIDPKAPDLKLEGTVDFVWVSRGLHGMVNNGTLSTYLAEFHAALKPKGVLGVEQHRAKPDAVATESSKKGYLPEKWVIEQIEAAGFKLAAKSEINANPKDTKDYPEGVWSLPPTLREGEKDRAKYEAIGESDRMTLKFIKVDAKPAAPAAPKPATGAPPAATPAVTPKQ